MQRLEGAQVREAETYLESTAQRLRNDRLSVETRLLRGEVVPELLNLTGSDRCDLIVITSHGMSGLGSRVFGSVAQKLLYSASCPVLVIRCGQGDLQREEEREATVADATLLSQLSHAGQKGEQP
jgi:nucleotide-binding universal stress UspA family protein